MNMLGLWVLGPFVEYSLGRARWLFVYLASGLVGSIVLTVLPLLHWVDEEKCVGASGSIMGLVGATIAITLRGVLRERALIAKRRLMALGVIVVLQTTFDLLTPQVSFLAHASGLVSGFLFASMLVHRRAKSTEPLPAPMAVGVA
jgi:rhomboid protease GluP